MYQGLTETYLVHVENHHAVPGELFNRRTCLLFLDLTGALIYFFHPQVASNGCGSLDDREPRPHV